ncbi:MAG: hypothetical protein AAFZ01_01130 [Pseudomonadota bacterium]
MTDTAFPSEPPSMRYVRASQPWWVNLVFWAGRAALLGAILSMLVPIGYTLWHIFSGLPQSEKPAWTTGNAPIWTALWFLQLMIWSFLAVATYRGLKGLPLVFKDTYVRAFSFDAFKLWALLPLGLFLLPLQLATADWFILPSWTQKIYDVAALFVHYFGWLL